jgi:hypothetical protein
MYPEARERSFDELTRGLASGDISRGKALRLMGAALVGGTLASLGIGEAAADPPGCKRAGKRCKEDEQCCSGTCESGTCAAACVANGGTCSTSTDCCSGNCSNGFCCASGRVGLSNGTCAIPCTTAPECTGDCVCTGRSVNPAQGFCTTVSPGSDCATDAECPTGQFCAANIATGFVCTPAC